MFSVDGEVLLFDGQRKIVMYAPSLDEGALVWRDYLWELHAKPVGQEF